MAITTPAQVTVTSSQTQTVDPFLQSVLRSLLQEGAGLANRGYETFPGQRIADLTPDQQAAYQLIRNSTGQFSPLLDEAAGGLRSGMAGLQGLSFSPTQYQPAFNWQAPQIRSSFNWQAPSNGYQAGNISAPYLSQLASLAGQAYGTDRTVGTDVFDAAARDRYMSPYIQGVIDRQKRGATEDWQKQLADINARAGKAGSFGGSRHAIMESESREALGEQLQDIEARGLQSAYENAQQIFTSDEARQLQAAINSGQLNLQGLSTGLQGLGQASQLGLQGAQATEQAKQQQQQLINQLAQMGLQGAQTAAQLGLQAQVEQARLGLQGAQTQGQLGLAGAELRDKSSQFGSNLQLQGLQGLITGSGALAGLAGTGQQQLLQSAAALENIGSTQQQLNQSNLNLGYTDFLRQQQYPQQQLDWYSSLLRGFPYGQTTTSTGTQNVPNPTGQAIGLGIAGLGALGQSGAFGKEGWFSGLFNFNEGGLVPGFASGGLASLLDEDEREGLSADMREWSADSLRLLASNPNVAPEYRERAMRLLATKAESPLASLPLREPPMAKTALPMRPEAELLGQSTSFREGAPPSSMPWEPARRALSRYGEAIKGLLPAERRAPSGRSAELEPYPDDIFATRGAQVVPYQYTEPMEPPGIVGTRPGREAAASPVASRGLGAEAAARVYQDDPTADPNFKPVPGGAIDIGTPYSASIMPVEEVPAPQEPGVDWDKLGNLLTAFGVGMASGKSPTLLGMLGEGAGTAYTAAQREKQLERLERKETREDARETRKLDILEKQADEKLELQKLIQQGRYDVALQKIDVMTRDLERKMRDSDLNRDQRDRLAAARSDLAIAKMQAEAAKSGGSGSKSSIVQEAEIIARDEGKTVAAVLREFRTREAYARADQAAKVAANAAADSPQAMTNPRIVEETYNRVRKARLIEEGIIPPDNEDTPSVGGYTRGGGLKMYK